MNSTIVKKITKVVKTKRRKKFHKKVILCGNIMLKILSIRMK